MLSAVASGAQQASFGGRVLSEAGEKPMGNVEVTLEGTKFSVRSDSAGYFIIPGLSAGTYSLLARHLSFEPLRTRFVLKATEKVEVDLLLKPSVTTLTGVDVTATATAGPWAIQLAEFNDRRVMGAGRYLTAEYFESKSGAPASSFLQEKIPGLRFVQSSGRRWIASTRGCGAGACTDAPRDPKRPGCLEPSVVGTLDCVAPNQCYMQVIVNGVIRYDGTGQMFDIDQLNSKDIIGFEFYTVATTPLQYNRSSGASKCGTVIVWTK